MVLWSNAIQVAWLQGCANWLSYFPWKGADINSMPGQNIRPGCVDRLRATWRRAVPDLGWRLVAAHVCYAVSGHQLERCIACTCTGSIVLAQGPTAQSEEAHWIFPSACRHVSAECAKPSQRVWFWGVLALILACIFERKKNATRHCRILYILIYSCCFSTLASRPGIFYPIQCALLMLFFLLWLQGRGFCIALNVLRGFHRCFVFGRCQHTWDFLSQSTCFLFFVFGFQAGDLLSHSAHMLAARTCRYSLQQQRTLVWVGWDFTFSKTVKQWTLSNTCAQYKASCICRSCDRKLHRQHDDIKKRLKGWEIAPG